MQKNIQIDLIFAKLKQPNRKKLLEFLSDEISRCVPCPKISLYAHFVDHARKDQAGIGDGVALPHIKMRSLPRRFIALATLHTPISDFETPDGKPVDLLCCLLSPETDGPLHLRGLSRLSRMLRQKELADKIRAEENPEAMRALLNGPDGWLLAA